MKLSFVVPIYNAEQYLSRCFDSILKVKVHEIEIIAVNDGSTDSSEIICKEYANKDSRIKYSFQDNAGVSVARNNGIKLATGDYICFVDSDDEIVAETVDDIVAFEDDIILFDYYTNAGEENTYCKRKSVDSNNSSWSKIMFSNRNNAIWNNIYRLSLLQNEKIKFKENMAMGEDFLFNLSLLRLNPTLCYIEKPLYVYYLDSLESAMKKHKLRYVLDYVEMNQALEQYYLEMNDKQHDMWIRFFMDMSVKYLLVCDPKIDCYQTFEESELFKQICKLKSLDNKRKIKKNIIVKRLYRNQFIKKLACRLLYRS